MVENLQALGPLGIPYSARSEVERHLAEQLDETIAMALGLGAHNLGIG